jgi:hypothetical protein
MAWYWWYLYGAIVICLVTCVFVVVDERRFKKVSPYILVNTKRKNIKIAFVSLAAGLLWPGWVCLGICVMLYLALIREPKKKKKIKNKQGTFVLPEERINLM